MKAFAPGIYPRSAALVQATRDLDRGRATAEDVDRTRASDLEALVADQRDAGFELLSDGMLAWQDLFRPLVDASEGLEAGPLTRFLDTNTFFRAPRATSTPRLTAPLGDEVVAPLDGPRLVTLPSPYAFGEAAGVDPRELASSVLAPAIDALDADLVVLAEPFLARQEDPDVPLLGEALAALPSRGTLVLQLTFGDASDLLEQLADLPVDGVGVDFYLTPLAAVPAGFPKLVLAGVVDTRSSEVEEPATIADFVARLRATTGGELALVPNGDLQFVAEPIAKRKLAALGAAKELAA
jgi:5-methyltetrahydropteroyltriglutamate--homocysteine methyltransferase